MKKMILILAVALILTMGACSAQRFENASELYVHWIYLGYPKAVCGVWSSDGTAENLTIGLTDNAAGDAMERKILNMVEDDSTLSFARLEHSYSELEKVQRRIRGYLAKSDTEVGVASYGIYDPGNCVCVDIIIDKPGAQDFMDWCNENFHGMIEFEEVKGYPMPA